MAKKNSKKSNLVIGDKSYSFHKIIWEDITGDSTIASLDDFNKMKTSLITTYALIYKKNDKYFIESGLAEWLDDTPSPKEFRITIARQKKSRYEEYFKALAHEMVHVKQYARNEMTSLVKNVGPNLLEQSWRGIKVKVASSRSPVAKKTKIITDNKGYDYYYQPWEVEAFGLEVGLYAYYKEQHRNKWIK